MGSRLDPLSPAEHILYYSLEFLDSMSVVKTMNVKRNNMKNRCEQQSGIFVVDFGVPYTAQWQRPRVIFWCVNLVRPVPIDEGTKAEIDLPEQLTTSLQTYCLPFFPSLTNVYWVHTIAGIVLNAENINMSKTCFLPFREPNQPLEGADIKRTDSNQPLISCSELYLTECFHFLWTLHRNHL